MLPVRFVGAVGVGKCLEEFLGRQQVSQVQGTRFNRSKSFCRRQADRNVVERKPARNVTGENGDRLRPRFGRQENVATQVEQTNDFVAAVQRFTLPRRGNAERRLATRLTARNATSAIQFRGRRS